MTARLAPATTHAPDTLEPAHDWMLSSVCARVGPDLWDSTNDDERQAAKRLCATCPVRATCLDHTLKLEGDLPRSKRYGIAGGMDGRGRRAEWERRKAEAGQPVAPTTHGGGRHRAPCGTVAAQVRHRRYGETCIQCNTPRPEPQPTARHHATTAA